MSEEQYRAETPARAKGQMAEQSPSRLAAPAKEQQFNREHRATASPGSGDHLDAASPGISSEVSRRSRHWHFRRRLRRKYLRLTNRRIKEAELAGIRRAILPMGIGMLLLLVIATTFLISYTTNIISLLNIH